MKKPVLERKIKIDENTKNETYAFNTSLKTISERFMGNQILSKENLDKKWRQINEASKVEDKDTGKKSKKLEDKAIFLDIFIKPKENKIKEIAEKRNKNAKKIETKVEDKKHKTYISNKISENGKILGMNATSTQTNFDFKKYSTSQDFNADDLSKDTKQLINENDLKTNLSVYLKNDNENDIKILNAFIHHKYIIHKGSEELSKKNYFNQLVQIRTPEGINAAVASPLMDSKGWAPSIPSVNIDKTNTNLNDLMTRAKGGIKAGDITKEAHMAFYLGIMNEEEKKYEAALKFYKKYFLSAKLLQDIYGTELALNRIAVLFSNLYDYEQSKYYNEKHKEITTHNLNAFVAYYNCGVCYRILEQFDKSIDNFNQALKLSDEENVYFILTLGLGVVYALFGAVGDFLYLHWECRRVFQTFH